MHVLDMLRSYLLRLRADKGLSTKFVIEEGLEGKSFLTDRKKLTQAISNFYNNAIKFSDKGGVILSCSLKNDRLLIEVSDSGPGISQEDQKKLFKKFSQIDSSNTKDFKGSGLRLNITQELIELMNGKVGVVSEEGLGSTLWIEIPFIETNQSSTELRNDDYADLSVLKRKRILIVEDNNINIKVMSLILESQNMLVSFQMNGKEGVDDILNNDYDLVLMDIQMPVMDGVTAMKELIKSGKKIPPVFAVTANAMEGDRDKYLSLGFSSYIAKPFKKDEILKHLALHFSEGLD